MSNWIVVNNTDELYHHGIKGQRWGVRRFQNEDGTLTRKGLLRYNKASDTLAKRKAEYKDARKNGGDVYKAKLKLADAKHDEKMAYKQLRQSSKADKGKELYREGKTITGISYKQGLGQLALSATTALGPRIILGQKNTKWLMTKNGDIPVNQLKAVTLMAGCAVASAALNIKAESEKSRLRSYYAYSNSNYHYRDSSLKQIGKDDPKPPKNQD